MGGKMMDEAVGEDISGVNLRLEVEATGVEGNEGGASHSPEEFFEENERGRGRKLEWEGGGEGEGEGDGEGEGEGEGVIESEGEGEDERESGSDHSEAGVEEVGPEADAVADKVKGTERCLYRFSSLYFTEVRGVYPCRRFLWRRREAGSQVWNLQSGSSVQL